jgi:hypothetical protein
VDLPLPYENPVAWIGKTEVLKNENSTYVLYIVEFLYS